MTVCSQVENLYGLFNGLAVKSKNKVVCKGIQSLAAALVMNIAPLKKESEFD